MAELDTMPTMGLKKAKMTKAMATMTLEKPVRAPEAAPEALSTKVVIEEAPMKPPTTAAAESTVKILPISFTLPSSSTNLPASATATAVPIVSKKSLISSEKAKSSSAGCKNTWSMAMLPVEGTVWKGAAKVEKSKPKLQSVGSGVTPRGMPTMVATMMEMSRAPRTFMAVRITATAMASSETMTAGEVKSPAAMSVDSLSTMTPPPFMPTKAMNRPMPMPMEWRKVTGMARMMASRSPQTTRAKMTTPSIKTTAMATRQSTATGSMHRL